MIWSQIAQVIAASPWLINALIKLAQRTPYIHITRPDGTEYMRRWWLVKQRKWLPFSVRIHHIMGPDHDRHLHDHPFSYRTIILKGWYIEENVFGDFNSRIKGDTVDAPALTFHRINKVSDGGVWTLFIMGRRTNGWGFLVDGHKVDWRTYLGI